MSRVPDAAAHRKNERNAVWLRHRRQAKRQLYAVIGFINERGIKVEAIGNAESGKVYVKGKAAGKYTCDMVTIKITFCAFDVSASKASEAVMTQCEKFLQRLEEAGIDISRLRLHDDSVDQPSYLNDDRVKAARTLIFDSSASAEINNFLLSVIREEHIDADVSTDYYLSNEKEIRKQLRARALEDSRENAELLADTAGKTIAGIYTIDMNHHQAVTPLAKNAAIEGGFECLSCSFSPKLSMPTKDIEEEVDAVWLIG